MYPANYYIFDNPGHFTIEAPSTKEMVNLSELIEDVKQYQDEEYKAMQSAFDHVEQLLRPISREDSTEQTTEQTQMQSHSEDRPEVTPYANNRTMQNHYRYTKWTLIFFLILFFGVMIQIYLGRFSEHISNVLKFLKIKK